MYSWLLDCYSFLSIRLVELEFDKFTRTLNAYADLIKIMKKWRVMKKKMRKKKRRKNLYKVSLSKFRIIKLAKIWLIWATCTWPQKARMIHVGTVKAKNLILAQRLGELGRQDSLGRIIKRWWIEDLGDAVITFTSMI